MNQLKQNQQNELNMNQLKQNQHREVRNKRPATGTQVDVDSNSFVVVALFVLQLVLTSHNKCNCLIEAVPSSSLSSSSFRRDGGAPSSPPRDVNPLDETIQNGTQLLETIRELNKKSKSRNKGGMSMSMSMTMAQSPTCSIKVRWWINSYGLVVQRMQCFGRPHDNVSLLFALCL